MTPQQISTALAEIRRRVADSGLPLFFCDKYSVAQVDQDEPDARHRWYDGGDGCLSCMAKFYLGPDDALRIAFVNHLSDEALDDIPADSWHSPLFEWSLIADALARKA